LGATTVPRELEPWACPEYRDLITFRIEVRQRVKSGVRNSMGKPFAKFARQVDAIYDELEFISVTFRHVIHPAVN